MGVHWKAQNFEGAHARVVSCRVCVACCVSCDNARACAVVRVRVFCVAQCADGGVVQGCGRSWSRRATLRGRWTAPCMPRSPTCRPTTCLPPPTSYGKLSPPHPPRTCLTLTPLVSVCAPPCAVCACVRVCCTR
jgi:hypothetical protein